MKKFLISWLTILTTMLLIVCYLGCKGDKKPIMGKGFLKANETGLVTVWGEGGKIICQFYDTTNIIARSCPDTVLVFYGRAYIRK